MGIYQGISGYQMKVRRAKGGNDSLPLFLLFSIILHFFILFNLGVFDVTINELSKNGVRMIPIGIVDFKKTAPAPVVNKAEKAFRPEAEPELSGIKKPAADVPAVAPPARPPLPVIEREYAYPVVTEISPADHKPQVKKAEEFEPYTPPQRTAVKENPAVLKIEENSEWELRELPDDVLIAAHENTPSPGKTAGNGEPDMTERENVVMTDTPVETTVMKNESARESETLSFSGEKNSRWNEKSGTGESVSKLFSPGEHGSTDSSSEKTGENRILDKINLVAGSGFENFQEMVTHRVENSKHYPEEAREMRLEGRVIISFVISPDGNVKNMEILKSSGHELLDESARKAVLKGSPYLPYPAGVNKPTKVKLTLNFKMGRN